MRCVIAVFIVFLSVPNLNSQISVSASGGANYGNIFRPNQLGFDEFENKYLTSILNFNGGFYAEYDFQKIGVSSGFFVSRRGTKVGSESYFRRILKLKTIQFYFYEIPCLIRYKLNKKVEIGGGIINSLLINADILFADSLDQPYQADLRGMVRYKILPKLNLEVGYTYGGLNHFDDLTYYGHSVFNLNVSYRLASFKL